MPKGDFILKEYPKIELCFNFHFRIDTEGLWITGGMNTLIKNPIHLPETLFYFNRKISFGPSNLISSLSTVMMYQAVPKECLSGFPVFHGIRNLNLKNHDYW